MVGDNNKEQLPDEILLDVVRYTVREVGFIDIRNCEEIHDRDESICSLQKLISPISGKIYLDIPIGLVKRISTNLFGDEVDTSNRESLNDCVVELLNVVTGRFMQRLVSDQVFDVSLPGIVHSSEYSKNEYHTKWFETSDKNHFAVSYNIKSLE